MFIFYGSSNNGPALVNEDQRVENTYIASWPIMMLVVYGPTNGIRECQKEFGYCCIYLNLDYASNTHSYGVVTFSNTNYLDLKASMPREQERKKENIPRNSKKEHWQKNEIHHENTREIWRRRILLIWTITCNKTNFMTSSSPSKISPYYIFTRCLLDHVNFDYLTP